jgi:hypothetical protein
MRQWMRSHLTFANVASLTALFVALGGTTYAATGGKFILGQSNTASSKSTLSAPIADKALTVTNNSTKAGATALGLNVASGHPPFRVNSGTKVANLNADQVDGQESTAFGQVREFSHTIAAASAGPPPFDMLTFRGLKLSSEGRIITGPLLECDLEVTTTRGGQFDNAWIFRSPGQSDGTALSNGSSTPVDHFLVARARGNGSRSVGQLVFREAATGRTLTVAYSVYGIPDPDINSQGCTWQGTVTAAG